MVIYRQEVALAEGDYLSGRYAWAEETLLVYASLSGRPPADAPARVTLELGGVLQPQSITIPATGRDWFQTTLALHTKIAADTPARWKITAGTGNPSNAALRVTVVMSAVPFSRAGCAAAGFAPSLRVRWVHGGEVIDPLFLYNPLTHTFAEASAGLATGRAAIVNTWPDDELTVSMQSVDALKVTETVFQTGDFRERGSYDSPRLEFMSGSRRLGLVSKTGIFYVPWIREGSPAPGVDRFEFYSNQLLTATLSEAGLVAEAVEEPL